MHWQVMWIVMMAICETSDGNDGSCNLANDLPMGYQSTDISSNDIAYEMALFLPRLKTVHGLTNSTISGIKLNMKRLTEFSKDIISEKFERVLKSNNSCR
jgi:hypothetical protein